MNIFEAKQILNNAGYCVINEREINLNYLIKDIFELLTSFGISATDDEVERLMRTYINSGRKPENSNAEDILEFDIDNAPDTIIDYTSDFIDWIKRGQYKTGPVDEAKQILKNAGYLVESDNQDIPEKYSTDVYNNIYAEFSNKDEFQRFYDENKEKIDDYTKFGWKMHYTAEFVARSIVDDLYLEY